jgi:hypothetical protein
MLKPKRDTVTSPFSPQTHLDLIVARRLALERAVFISEA